MKSIILGFIFVLLVVVDTHKATEIILNPVQENNNNSQNIFNLIIGGRAIGEIQLLRSDFTNENQENQGKQQQFTIQLLENINEIEFNEIIQQLQNNLNGQEIQQKQRILQSETECVCEDNKCLPFEMPFFSGFGSCFLLCFAVYFFSERKFQNLQKTKQNQVLPQQQILKFIENQSVVQSVNEVNSHQEYPQQQLVENSKTNSNRQSPRKSGKQSPPTNEGVELQPTTTQTESLLANNQGSVMQVSHKHGRRRNQKKKTNQEEQPQQQQLLQIQQQQQQKTGQSESPIREENINIEFDNQKDQKIRQQQRRQSKRP